MHPLIRTLALVAATGLVSGGVSAQISQRVCAGFGTRVQALNLLLAGKTLCAASGGDRWQEHHRFGGALWDYKLGPSSTTDPTALVGTWSATSDTSGSLNPELTHTYGTSIYTWAVCQVGNANTYTLVSTSGGATITGATVQTGGGPCL
jgi:hypothetical protein